MKEEDYKHIAIIHNMAKDYGILTNEEIHKTYEVINKIKQLETNWKELKKWGENLREYYKSMIGKYDYSDEDKVIKDMLDKMQEIESDKNG